MARGQKVSREELLNNIRTYKTIVKYNPTKKLNMKEIFPSQHLNWKYIISEIDWTAPDEEVLEQFLVRRNEALNIRREKREARKEAERTAREEMAPEFLIPFDEAAAASEMARTGDLAVYKTEDGQLWVSLQDIAHLLNGASIKASLGM